MLREQPTATAAVKIPTRGKIPNHTALQLHGEHNRVSRVDQIQ